METTDKTTKSAALMTMDEFLEYLETRGSRNTTSTGASTELVGYPLAPSAPETPSMNYSIVSAYDPEADIRPDADLVLLCLDYLNGVPEGAAGDMQFDATMSPRVLTMWC